MIKTNSIELIKEIFMSTAFEIVKKQHSDFDDIDALSLAWMMLWSASDVYDEAIEKGETQVNAISNAYKSIAS